MADGFFRSKKGYTVVQNEITRDRDISLKAKGLYLVIQANITMPDKKWRKEDFQAMTCEGKKAFDGAWNELKEAGYLRVHMYSKGVTWTVEYELLDEAVPGAHTFYYNAQGELTRTNIERAASRAEKKANESNADSDIEAVDFRTPHFGSNGNGYNGSGSNGNGCNGNGNDGIGSNGNGDNNNSNNLFSNPNDNYLDNKSSIKSYPQNNKVIDGEIDDCKAYIEIIKENIDYEELMSYHDPEERQRFDEMYQLICDVVCVPREMVRVNGEDYPYELVKAQFLKLNNEHIKYVSECMDMNMGKVNNIRAYLITALYNAPSTLSNHIAQDYRTSENQRYVSEFEYQNKLKIQEMKRLQKEDPEAYRLFIRNAMKN